MLGYWHALTKDELLEKLHARESGLTAREADERLLTDGRNSLPESKPESVGALFLRQFESPLIYVLIGASAIIFLIGDIIDAGIILSVLFFNALIGTLQEGRAQHTLRALKRFAETDATVLRDGRERIIRDTEVVSGDIIFISEGEKIPADARLIISHGLKVDESSLTGESTPIDKSDRTLSSREIPTPEQTNMVFKGSSAVSGRAVGVVVATGVQTVIGAIAAEIATIDTDIPLKADIRKLSRVIIVAVTIIAAFFFILGLVRGEELTEMFKATVAIAVSVIPEGLPIALTLVLATGVWRMSKQNALIKKLQAVEALGQADVLAVDKTGTLTKNEMIVRELYTNGKLFSIGGSGYEPTGDVVLDGIVTPSTHKDLILAAKIAAFNTSARLSYADDEKRWRISGDPTDAAILVLSEKLGFARTTVDREFPTLVEGSFDYVRRYRLGVRDDNGVRMLTVTGAPEVLIGMASKVYEKSRAVKLTDEKRARLFEMFESMSLRGLRIVAFGMKRGLDELSDKAVNDAAGDITLVGLFGIVDSVRPEARSAVENVRLSGMRIVMITGDHAMTARAVAKEVGIFREGDRVLSGEDMDRLTHTELLSAVQETSVFARVTPEHKLRIIRAFKEAGLVVAMTGDGVNDAPSLVAADLGVAMGGIGTEVAKEASDIVLLDDNFGSITAAVEEGRNIYRTVKKVVLYLFSTSVGEILTIVGALIVGLPLPLIAGQIIWLNFVTDGFLVTALAMEPKEKNILKQRFTRASRSLIDGAAIRRMLVMAIPMMVGTLVLFSLYLDDGIEKAWTISLTTLAVFQWFNAWNCRSDRESVFSAHPLSNVFLLLATALTVLLHLAAIYTPLMQAILRTVPLSLDDWLLIIPVALSIVFVEELRKAFARMTHMKVAL